MAKLKPKAERYFCQSGHFGYRYNLSWRFCRWNQPFCLDKETSSDTFLNENFDLPTVSLEELTLFNEFWPSNIHKILGVGHPSGAAHFMPYGSPSSTVSVLKIFR